MTKSVKRGSGKKNRAERQAARSLREAQIDSALGELLSHDNAVSPLTERRLSRSRLPLQKKISESPPKPKASGHPEPPQTNVNFPRAAKAAGVRLVSRRSRSPHRVDLVPREQVEGPSSSQVTLTPRVNLVPKAASDAAPSSFSTHSK